MKDLYDLVDDVLAHSRTQGTLRLIMAGLVVHINVETRETRPGIARLARWTGKSEKTVQRGLRTIEEELAEIVRVAAGHNGRAATYRVVIGTSSRTSMDVHLREPSTGHRGRHSGGSSRTSHGVSAEQERSNNYPSFSPSSNRGGAQLEAIAPDLFQTILRRLALDIGNAFIAHTYVEPLEQRGRRGDVLEVLAPDYCELELARRYGARLTAIAREVLGERVDVEIVTERQLHRGARGGSR